MNEFSREEAASLGTYLGIFRRRAWIVIVCAAIAPIVGYALANRQTAQYASSSEVYVNQTNIASALTGISSNDFSSDALAVDTQATLADVPAVAAKALSIANLRDRAPADVLGELSISPDETTNILTFTIVDSSPTVARLLATSYAQAFTRYSNGQQSQPIVKARQELEVAMSNLQAEGRKNSALYTSLSEKDQQLQTLQTLGTSSTVVARGGNAGAQISPHPKRDAALGLGLGFMLGLGLAFGMEALDTRIRTTGDLTHGLGGLPLLARIPPPTSKMQKRDELVIVAEPKTAAAEAFRLLRTNLEFVRLSAGDVRVMLVSSAVEKEGKSTTSANLAVSEARSGRRVALVDLDLRRPSLRRFFQLSTNQGITDVALGTVKLEDALQRIDLRLGEADTHPLDRPVAEEGVLDVLTAGLLPPDPGEFVASYRLAEILARLRTAYDVVIVDTPPLLWVGDALTLSTQADGLILVSRLKGARRPMIRELRRVLDVVPAQTLGVVVTGPVPNLGRAYYGYKGRYGYGDVRERQYDPSRSALTGTGVGRAQPPSRDGR